MDGPPVKIISIYIARVYVNKGLNRAAKEMLVSAGLRRTGGRVEILEVLQQAKMPLNQEEILAQLDRDLNRTTVYRTLESFIQAGLVHRCFVRERAWHYELAHNCRPRQCHPHFTCTNCNRTLCLKNVFLPLVEDIPEGFVIQRQQVRIEGLCPDCSRG